MNNNNDLFSSVMLEAEKPGPELAPNKLLDTVLLQPNPIHMFSVFDQGNNRFDAMHQEFGFMQAVRITGQPSTEEEMGRWVALVRWLIREFREWRTQDDPQYHKLTALFVTASSCDINEKFWTSFPNGIEKNHQLLSMLEKLISGSSITFSSRGFGTVPIWENEAAEKFEKADAEGDWFKISEQWVSFENVCFPNIIFVQAVRCLHRFGFEFLVRALEGVSQTPIAMQVAGSLPIGQRLDLGFASNNPYIQFGCVFQTISQFSETNHLSDTEQKSLKRLLLCVTSDGPRWAKWMQVFNRYPLRYSAIQTALGHTLAVAPEAAIKAYFDAINLSTSYNDSRRSVAECLRSFRTTATPDRCKVLWGLAFQRWSEWEFGSANKDVHLFEIGCSELDYGIVAYAVECMSDAERDAMLTEIHAKLIVLNNKWHSSITECISKWNRLLSQFQPYAHAAQTKLLAEDWLAEGKHYWPSDFNSKDYLKMMYRIR